MDDPTPPKDPLRELYHESFVHNPAFYRYLINRAAAVLCIDMQYLDAARGFGVFHEAEESGVPLDYQEYYFDQLETTVIPNIRKVQDIFRERSLEVIHTRIQALTKDGRDRSRGHKRLQLLAPPGSKDAEFLEEVAPQDDEIVINKTASGVFSSTNLHYVLRNVGIDSLYVVGVYTNECVETTVRDACDLGYIVTLIEDCCTTVTPELHRASLATLRDRYCRVISTQEVLDEVNHFTSTVAKD